VEDLDWVFTQQLFVFHEIIGKEGVFNNSKGEIYNLALARMG
jgi:hypothetical protein